jgi:hypothetical protein
VRPLPAALAACALLAAPLALSAQTFTQKPLPPNVRTVPPVKRPHPMPTGAMHHYPNGNRNGNSYPVVIDGSVLNRYLATSTPKPKHTPAMHHTSDGQDVFETHSTDDAK